MDIWPRWSVVGHLFSLKHIYRQFLSFPWHTLYLCPLHSHILSLSCSLSLPDLEWLWNQDASRDLLLAIHPPNYIILWNGDTGTKLWKKSYAENILSFSFDPFDPSNMACRWTATDVALPYYEFHLYLYFSPLVLYSCRHAHKSDTGGSQFEMVWKRYWFALSVYLSTLHVWCKTARPA